MSFVFHVRSWRKRLGWSRKVAAEKLGVSVHTIKSYELCRRELPTPVCKLMMRLEEELGSSNDTTEDTVIIGGGFISIDKGNQKAPSLVYPCFGQTAKAILSLYQAYEKSATVIYSRMAHAESRHENVEDLKGILTAICSKNNIKTVHLACTSVDFEASEYIKQLRSDISVVEYGRTRDGEKEISRFADYSFWADGDHGRESHYFSYGLNNDLVLDHSDKEIVLASLIECIVGGGEILDEIPLPILEKSSGIYSSKTKKELLSIGLGLQNLDEKITGEKITGEKITSMDHVNAGTQNLRQEKNVISAGVLLNS